MNYIPPPSPSLSPESAEAVVFLGFDESTAQNIFERWSTRDNDRSPDDPINYDTLAEYAKGEVRRLQSHSMQGLSSTEAMEAIGIAEELQEAILDPKFTKILWTEDLEFWLLDTIQLRWLTLCLLQDRLKEKAISSLAARKNRKGNSPSKDLQLNPAFIAVAAEPKPLEGHITLYKGKAVPEMRPHAFLKPDGSINMLSIASAAGGDFNSTSRAWYWTKEKETAELYRGWAARRCQHAESWLIQVQVPEAWVNTLSQSRIDFSPEWRELVWLCKRQEILPAKFDEYVKKDLLQGDICTGDALSIASLKFEEIHQQLTHRSILGKQWVIMNDQAAMQMGDQMRGKVHVTKHLGLQSEGDGKKKK